MLGTLLLVAQAAFAVECAEPISHEEISGKIAVAEAAYRDLDDTLFRDSVNEVAGILLPCAKDALPKELVARYHRLMALHLFTIGDSDNALLSAMSAKSVQPDEVWDEEMVPANHELRVAWDSVEPDTKTRKVPEPKAGSLAFDGDHTRDRPRNLPTVAQVFNTSGLSERTYYLGPNESLPTYAAIPRQRNTLLACSGGAVLLSGIGYGMAWSANASLYELAADTSNLEDTLDGKRAQTNALTLLSGALLGVGAGCGTGAVLVGQR